MTDATSTPPSAPSEAVLAATMQRLLTHLRHRTDVQNVDIMGTAGFCRNCLADWLMEADGSMTKEQARTYVYGMPYGDYKDAHQTPASEAQLAAMKESVAKNADAG